MSATKKIRPEAKLKLLPDAVQFTIAEYASKPGVTLAQTCAWLEVTHKIKVAPSTLSHFLADFRAAELQERVLGSILNGSRLNSQVDGALAKNPPPSVENLMRVVKFLVSQLAARGAVDEALLDQVAPLLARVLDFEKLGIKRAEVALEERRVKLLEDKAAQADAAKKVAGDAGMSAEEKEAEMKRIFGM